MSDAGEASSRKTSATFGWRAAALGPSGPWSDASPTPACWVGSGTAGAVPTETADARGLVPRQYLPVAVLACAPPRVVGSGGRGCRPAGHVLHAVGVADQLDQEVAGPVRRAWRVLGVVVLQDGHGNLGEHDSPFGSVSVAAGARTAQWPSVAAWSRRSPQSGHLREQVFRLLECASQLTFGLG